MPEITLDPSNPLNLDVTFCCGQAFRWEKRGGWWYGIVGEQAFRVRQNGERILFENVDEKFIRNYFGLNYDLSKILNKICKDNYVRDAVKAFMGLRILRQEPWECLASYICATYKNISAIRKMLANLSRKFGEKIQFEGLDFYSFPTKETIAKVKAEELADCGLGYRAKYVCETAKMLCESNFDFKRFKTLSYEKARNELLNFSGVGNKVADCVLLFSLDKLEAFPIDVWIKRVILNFYAQHFPQQLIKKLTNKKSLTPSEYRTLNLFGRNYFGEYAGYAQEYLYHYMRTQF
ncbi:MAG: DNA-3-methyladenine glycosylase family protein [Candidatus Bathyarchaeia archaeon]|nr:MAG: 8-oxoguanine DNA glycosylase [Candidatus Bathyarchaeota archaeon]